MPQAAVRKRNSDPGVSQAANSGGIVKLPERMPAADALASAPAASPAPLLRKLKRWIALRRDDLKSYGIGAVALLAFLLFWHLATTYRIDIYIRFLNVPTPEAVLDRGIHAFSSPRFVNNVAVSIRRIALGFSLATLIAVPLGLVMGRFRLVRDWVYPVSEILRPIPAIAWVPMSIMLWPTTEASIVFITFLGSFFPILINTLHGMVTLDKVLVRAARSLGAGEWQLFWEIYLPGTMPHVFTGLTVGMGVAWVSLIAAEMISGQFGIGYFTWESYSLIQFADVVLGMACIGILGLVSSWLIRAIGAAVMPWFIRASRQTR